MGYPYAEAQTKRLVDAWTSHRGRADAHCPTEVSGARASKPCGIRRGSEGGGSSARERRESEERAREESESESEGRASDVEHREDPNPTGSHNL